MALSLKLPGKNSGPQSTVTSRVTGTSLSARPAIDPPAELYKEYGSERGNVIRDVVPELASKTLELRTYNKMVTGDVSCRISLRAGKAPVLGGDFYIDPFDETEINVQVSEFVEQNLFHMPSTPWSLLLWDILHMFEYKTTVFEPVFGLREWAPKKTSPGANRKQYTMLNKMAYRPPSTIAAFNYDDNGGPLSVTHNAIRANNNTDEVTLDIDKLVIFAYEGDGNSLEGQSILRPAYEHWYYKHNLYKIDAIQKERHGIGIPDVELQPGYSEADRKAAWALARNLRTNESAFIVRPAHINVGFAELKGQLVNALESAGHHDLMIMKNILIQFLENSTAAGSGGRATSATSADIFLKSMRYIGAYICEIINKFLIPKIVAYNFDTDQFPQLKVRNIGEVKDLQMWATAIANLVDKEVITMDDDTEQFCRDVAQIPRRRTPRPRASELGISNLKAQWLLKDDPNAPEQTDTAGEAALIAAQAKSTATGGGGTGATSGNINKGTLNGA